MFPTTPANTESHLAGSESQSFLLRSEAVVRSGPGVAFWIPVLLLLLTLSAPAAAKSGLAGVGGEFKENPNQPWFLEADEVLYEQPYDLYVARGNVKITRGDKQLSADFIRFNHQTMKAYAAGHVVLVSGQDILRGSSLTVDLDSQVGSIEDAVLFIKASNYHIQGKTIRKTGKDTYTADEASFTTCDGDKPAWKISGKDVKVKDNGSGSAWHAKILVKNQPVMYVPYIYYPARNKRQTGFLIPTLGLSDRKGYSYNQPFFWAISDSTDATFYGRYMTVRGLKLGGEYRYIWRNGAKGALMLDGFRDRKVDDGHGDSSKKYGFEDASENFLRTNKDRFWFRMSHHQQVPLGLYAKLDVDWVSDQDYLREFPSGPMGFKESGKYFDKYFSRALDDINDPHRTNRLNLSRSWPKFSFNAEARWYQDSTQKNSSEPDTTVQRLPFLQFTALKQQIWTSPFYFDLGSEFDYFYRVSGPRGQRIDVNPRLYLPWRYQNYFTFEPSVGLRETGWRLNRLKYSESSNRKRYEHRELYDTRLDLFSEIYKPYTVNIGSVDRIKHSIRPEIIHEYIPHVDQPDFPEFDAIDRIDKKNLLSYSLINTLTSRSVKHAPVAVAHRKDAQQATIYDTPSDFSYNEFLRFKVAQSYDFNTSHRPFKPLLGKLTLYPEKYFSVDTEAGWSVYDREFLIGSVVTHLWDTRGDKFYVEYRYEKGSDELAGLDNIRNLEIGEKAQSLAAALTVQVTAGLKVFGNYEYNFVDNDLIEAGGGISYNSQCWGVDTQYTQTADNYKFHFMIKLFGLGGLGL